MKNYDDVLGNERCRAFLALIRKAEGAGYSTLFGGGTFAGFADHPRQRISRPLGGRLLTSTAAGAYQFLARTWDECAAACGLKDFSPASQDTAALFLIDRREAMGDVLAGDWQAAIAKCNKEWASLPGSPYGQPTKKLADCLAFLDRAAPGPTKAKATVEGGVGIAPRSVGRGAPAGGSASGGDAGDRDRGARIPLRGRIPEGAPAPRFAVAPLASQPGMSTLGRIFVMPAFLRALKSGEELANAATWKNRQSLVNAVTVLALAGAEIARAYGYPVPFADDQITAVAGVVVVLLFNLWATIATSELVGLPSVDLPVGAAGTAAADPGGMAGEPAVVRRRADADPPLPVLNWPSDGR